MEICIYASEPPVCVRGLVPVFSPGSHDNDLITGIMGFRGTGIIRLRKRPRAAIRRFTFACESLGHPPRLVPVYTFVPGETFLPCHGIQFRPRCTGRTRRVSFTRRFTERR